MTSTGHKYRPAYDFDYVALDLLQVYPEENGVYKCTARNAYGQAETSATVKVVGKREMSGLMMILMDPLKNLCRVCLDLHFTPQCPHDRAGVSSSKRDILI